MSNNKRYCFVNLRDLKMKDKTTNEIYNPVLEAAIYNVPLKYQYLVMVFDSKFNGPSFWDRERNEVYEFITKHSFDASKSRIIKEDNNTFVTNIVSAIFNDYIILNTKLDFKTINDVGLFINTLILDNCYDNYYKMIQEIFKNYILMDEEDQELSNYAISSTLTRQRDKRLIS